MKALILAASAALGLGLMASAPAGAAPLAVKIHPAAPQFTTDVACRVVTKRVRRPNGSMRVTKTRVCDRDRRDWRDRRDHRDRRVYRPAPRPGISIRVNP